MKKILYILALALSISSCQDVIELDVASKAAKLVVDGWIDSDSFPKIYLYKSLPYFDNNEFPKVSGALVTLNDGSTFVTLTESAPGSGLYTNNTIKGVVGKTYTLNITVDGKDYQAVSVMPKTIERFDSVYFRPLPFAQQGKDPDTITMFAYQELPEIGSCYMARFAKNDTMDLKNLNFTNDQFISGIHVVDAAIGERVKSGDRIRIEAYGITPEYYGYLLQIIDNVYRQQGLFSPPIAPFKGNVSNGGLGFFRASAMIAKDTIVP